MRSIHAPLGIDPKLLAHLRDRCLDLRAGKATLARETLNGFGDDASHTIRVPRLHLRDDRVGQGAEQT